MSWLYSIVFAGLIFSSGSSSPTIGSWALDPASPATKAPRPAAQDETEKFEQSYPITANGRVSVSNVNGSIVVEAWDKNEIKLEATKIADSKEALADVEIKVDARADSFSVKAEYDNWRRGSGDKGWKNHGKLEVQFRLSVPRTAVLDEIETVNGSVTVANFTNVTKISAVNGNVTASNLRGTANLSTVNGEVTADFDRLETGSKISLETVNGRANLVIPSDANATLKAESLNGNITNDFGLPVRKGKYVGRDLYGRVGNGDVQIRLESVNGPLTVSRKNDGKSTNPSTNLLQQKGKADDDDDDENLDEDESGSISRRPARVKIDNAKLNKDIAKSMKMAAKVSAESAKTVKEQVELELPIINKIDVDALAKIEVNTGEIQRQVNESLARQNEALVRLSNANWLVREPFIEKKTNSFPVKGTPKVSIDAKGCSVKVRGWDQNEVKYVLTETAGRRNQKSPTVIENATDGSVSLKVVSGGSSNGSEPTLAGNSDTLRIEVFVPKRTNLNISTNGEIRLDGVSGEIELNGADESINVRDVDGKLHISSASAEVRVIGFKGDLDSRTGDGDVYLEGDFSSITGVAGDGNFVLTVPENQNANISANVEALGVEDLRVPTAIKKGEWRLGSGGPKYKFTMGDGGVFVRNSSTLMTNN